MSRFERSSRPTLEGRAKENGRAIDSEWIRENEAREFKFDPYVNSYVGRSSNRSKLHEQAEAIKRLLQQTDYIIEYGRCIDTVNERFDDLINEIDEKENNKYYSLLKDEAVKCRKRILDYLEIHNEATEEMLKKTDEFLSLFKSILQKSDKYLKNITESINIYKEMLPDIIDGTKQMNLDQEQELIKLITDKFNEFINFDYDKHNFYNIIEDHIKAGESCISLLNQLFVMDDIRDLAEQKLENGGDVSKLSNELVSKILNSEIINKDEYISKIVGTNVDTSMNTISMNTTSNNSKYNSVNDSYIDYEKHADLIVQAMARGEIDTDGQPIANNQEEISRGWQKGYTMVGIISIISIITSIAIIIFGIILSS